MFDCLDLSFYFLGEVLSLGVISWRLFYFGSHRAQLPVSSGEYIDVARFGLSGAHGVLPPVTCVGSYLVRTLMGGSEVRF